MTSSAKTKEKDTNLNLKPLEVEDNALYDLLTSLTRVLRETNYQPNQS